MLVQPYGILWAALGLLIGTGLSVLFELGLARSLLLAATRAFFQLYILGIVLSFVFQAKNIWINLGVILLMTLLATHAIMTRIKVGRYPGIASHAFLSLALGAWTTALFAGQVILEGPFHSHFPSYLHDAQIFLPFTGLLLGNSLSGISLGLKQWTASLAIQRDLIESRLAHGATRWEAAQPVFREAASTAVTPILNAMTVAGVVSLPGVMTGQILAGADPKSAVKYQIAALFMITLSTLLGVISALALGFYCTFNFSHQFALERMEAH